MDTIERIIRREKRIRTAIALIFSITGLIAIRAIIKNEEAKTMGGDYTETVKQHAVPAQASPIGKDTPASELEFHVSSGEAHFHDRTSKRKVAVPVADWYKAAKEIFGTTSSYNWKYTDIKNKTRLSIYTFIDGNKMRTEIQILPMEIDEVTESLVSFFNRSVAGK